MAHTLVKPYIDQAVPDDAPAVLALLKSRPAENADTFTFPTDGWYMVVRDERGISAFLIVRWSDDLQGLIAQQIEGECKDGNPTFRGIRGMRMLGKELHRRASEAGARVFSPVAPANKRHLNALAALGYDDYVIVKVREPGCSIF